MTNRECMSDLDSFDIFVANSLYLLTKSPRTPVQAKTWGSLIVGE